MEMLFEFIMVGLLHILDMVFTVLFIAKAKKYYRNAEIIEANHHRYFFKRFGLFKGSLISICISMPILLAVAFVAIVLDKGFFVYILIGMLSSIVYINYQSWVKYDRLKNELEMVN